MTPARAGLTAALLSCALAGGMRAAHAAAADSAPARAGADVPLPSLAALSSLSGREIQERVLANRFDSFVQTASMVSGDRAEREQLTRVEMWYRDLRGRDGGDPATLSKTIVHYTHPIELHRSGYLVIHRRDAPDDQFVYRASTRRIQRVNLRRQAVFGTDFSFEDLIPPEIDDFVYRRASDLDWEGRPVLVIEARPRADSDSAYAKIESWVDAERFVPLRARYWDRHDIEIKELRVEPESVERFDDVWVPRRSTMHDLRSGGYTRLHVEELLPNAELPRSVFDVRRLELR